MGMLVENIRQWAVEYKVAGFAEGFAKGFTESFTESFTECFAKGFAQSFTECFAECFAEVLVKSRTEGLEEGKRELLLRLIETKYGTEVRQQLTETLRRHTTTEALDQFGEWIIECDSAEELYQRIRSSYNGIS